MDKLTEEQFCCLKDAVRLARDEQIPRVQALKLRLKGIGYKDEDIKVALAFWAKFARV